VEKDGATERTSDIPGAIDSMGVPESNSNSYIKPDSIDSQSKKLQLERNVKAEKFLLFDEKNWN